MVISWSGGKDSCLACYRAMKDGYQVSALVNSVSVEYRRVRFHGVKDDLIQLQAQALGVPLIQFSTSADHYERDYVQGLSSIITPEVGGVVFGDIHLQHCLEWVEKICRDLGVKAIEPLWGQSSVDILSDFIEAGFEAIVVSTQANLLDEQWIGRKLNRQFLEDIRNLENIDACGENGEYHTFVIDGPIFKKRIEITDSQKIYRDGYWFLDIRDYLLTPKVSLPSTC